MRALERFLIAFALLSLIMRVAGMRDAPTMELIAISLLALFYLAVFPFFLRPAPEAGSRRSGLHWLLAFGSGAALTYCLISLLCFTLGWVTSADMLVNSSLIAAFLITGSIWGKRKGNPYWMELFWRMLILWLAIVIISFLALPDIGSLSHGPIQ